MNELQMLNRIEELQNEARYARAATERAFHRALVWEGKFRTVKHENNQLRKRIKKQDVTPPPDTTPEIVPNPYRSRP